MLAARMHKLVVGGGLVLGTASTACSQSSSSGASSNWHYVQWLDPSTIVADAGAVATWTDKSGLGNDVATPFPPFPSVDRGAANGLDAVRFELLDSGVTSGLTSAYSMSTAGFDWGTTDFATEIVVNLGAGAHGVYPIWAAEYVGSTPSWPAAGLLPLEGGVGADTWQVAAAPTTLVVDAGFGDGRFHLVAVRRATGTLQLRVDGSVRATTPDTDVLEAVQGIAVGGWPGDYAEVRVISGPILDADLLAIEHGMMQTYGIN